MVLHVSLMVMIETVNKLSTKPFQSIGSHKKFYPHWTRLSGVQSLLKNFDLSIHELKLTGSRLAVYIF